MTKNAVLMSIRPQYANKIFSGIKTVELRRVKPKFLGEGDLIFVYVSSPVKSLVGAFTVSSVTEKSLASLWRNVKDYAGVSRIEFLNYFQDAEKGVAIFIKDVWLLPKPIHLAELKKEVKGFYPPQSFRYTSVRQVESFQ
jgi:predicted transcriptional regulator